MKMLEFGIRGFRAGRTLEGAIEETIALAESMQKQAQEAPQQEPPPDPKAQAEAQKLSAETEALTQKTQAEVQKAQADAAYAKSQADLKIADMQARATEANQKFQREMMKLTEEIEFRRKENDLKVRELEASIRLKEMQLTQANQPKVQDQGPVEPEDPNEPARVISERAKFKAEYKKAQFEIQKMDLALAELKRRADAMGGVQEAIKGSIDPDELLGLKDAPKPEEPKPPQEREVTFVRDQNGVMSGARIKG